MSDRYNYLTVVLERDLKDEDAEPLIRAIAHFRGVLSVTPNVAEPESFLAKERARRELLDKLLEVFK